MFVDGTVTQALKRNFIMPFTLYDATEQLARIHPHVRSNDPTIGHTSRASRRDTEHPFGAEPHSVRRLRDLTTGDDASNVKGIPPDLSCSRGGGVDGARSRSRAASLVCVGTMATGVASPLAPPSMHSGTSIAGCPCLVTQLTHPNTLNTSRAG